MPGSNIFFTDSDQTSDDGTIVCHQISEAELLQLALKGGRVLRRLWARLDDV